MRKTINRTTVIVVLVLFLCLSVGYALFSDTITIEGTATAQGNFDIEVTCYTTIPDEAKNALSSSTISYMESNADNGYNNESCVVSDDKVTYSVGLEYPGARKWYAVKFTNVGSIDSKISAAAIIPQIENVTIKSYDSETDELVATVTGSGDFLSIETMIYQKEDNSYFDGNDASDEDFDYVAEEETQSYLLRAGKNWYWLFYANWPDSEKYSEDGIYYDATLTLEFPFEQYNG